VLRSVVAHFRPSVVGLARGGAVPSARCHRGSLGTVLRRCEEVSALGTRFGFVLGEGFVGPAAG
jgi:hypothetical protein